MLLGLDSVELDGAPTRRTSCESSDVVNDTLCADARTILFDLAATLDDDTWEQALESALRKRLVHRDDFAVLPKNVPGVRRVRRVLNRRGEVPATESLLETLMVQLIRTVPSLPPPIRQRVITWPSGTFVARVDLCWPDLGLFLELDGQGHQGPTCLRRAPPDQRSPDDWLARRPLHVERGRPGTSQLGPPTRRSR